MNEKIPTTLCQCIVKNANFSGRFFVGSLYEYFVIYINKIYAGKIAQEAEPIYFVKDPLDNDSYVMFSKFLFDQTFAKLHSYIANEDNTKIDAEDKEVSNDHSFIEANKYR